VDDLYIKAQEPAEGAALEPGSVRFHSSAQNEVMRLCANGDVIITGVVVANDPQLVTDFKTIMAHSNAATAPAPSTHAFPAQPGVPSHIAFTLRAEEILRFEGQDMFVRGQKVEDRVLVLVAFREWVDASLKGIERHGGN
jgi:hypothetical protein